jgi:hypothetical protein
VSDADIGRTLRAVVTATNVAGSATAVSNLSSLVQPAPRQEPPPSGPLAPSRISVIGATMTWRFAWTHSYTTVKSLVVRDLSAGVTVESACTGPGCHLARAAAKRFHGHLCHGGLCALRQSAGKGPELSVAALFRAMRLKAGARLRISIVEPGSLGRAYVFVVHKGRAPSVQIGCLAPGSFVAGSTC